MRAGRFQIRNKTLRPAAKKRVEDHRGNADAEAATGIDERFADAFREKEITRRTQRRAERGAYKVRLPEEDERG